MLDVTGSDKYVNIRNNKPWQKQHCGLLRFNFWRADSLMETKVRYFDAASAIFSNL